ncbi:MAG: SDR family NAD(P)-dependent oxidoreductase [Ruminococcaceae bacterium]|nr:SDR family NAD(P)-dependent oxidoreductase [Oscillospiraceae bacterium]
MKNILVTGATGGMGYATCKLLKEKGYNVFALDISEEPAIPDVFYLKTNLRNSEEISKAFNIISREISALDAIIHMAGIYDLNSLVEMPEEDFTRIFDVNIFSVYRINKTFLPLLKKDGKIIITSSELAPLDPLPFTGIYGITKTALEKYAFSLRTELSLIGISVAVIRPGAVKTNLLDISTTAMDKFIGVTKLYKCNAQNFEKIVNSVEAKNIPPERIAHLVCKILNKTQPKFVYNLNRNPLLRVLNTLPAGMQAWIIKKILD